MKALVVVDEHTYSYNGKIYLREFGHILIQRYLNIFEEVRIVARNKKVTSKEELGHFNVQITDERIDFFSLPFFQGPKEYAFQYFKVEKYLKTVHESCDVAIIRLPSTVGFTTLKYIIRNGMTYGLEIVAHQKQNQIETKNKLHKFLRKISHKRQLRACQHATGISYVTEKFLQKDYPPGDQIKFVTHYSTVELPNIFFSGSRKFPKKKPFILCHISHPIKSELKGYKTAIQVVKTLVEKGGNAQIRFAGDGPMVDKLKEFSKILGISERVKFCGLLDSKELLSFMKKSDMMILPTKAEGLPRVIIEAAATGLPCISTPVGGIPEIVPQDLLYAPLDVEGFSNRIEEVMKNPVLYENLSNYFFEKSKEYSINHLTVKRNDFYQKMKDYVANKNN